VGGRAWEQPWVQEGRVCVCELGGECVEGSQWSGENGFGSEWRVKFE